MIRSLKEKTPIVDSSAYVDQSAQVIGDVQIGPESSVWMNVVIRGDVNGIRIERQLTDEEVVEIRWYSDSYVKYRLDYMSELTVKS